MSGTPLPETGNAKKPPASSAADASWNNDIREMWEGADYPAIAECLGPAAREVATSAGRGAGSQALDLATGSRGLGVEWKEASMTQIPAADASVDVVTSGFGLIFAPDPQEALTEISRVLRTGGLLAFSAWTPTGTMGQMTNLIGEFLNRHKGAMAPFRWGDPAFSDAWLQPNSPTSNTAPTPCRGCSTPRTRPPNGSSTAPPDIAPP